MLLDRPDQSSARRVADGLAHPEVQAVALGNAAAAHGVPMDDRMTVGELPATAGEVDRPVSMLIADEPLSPHGSNVLTSPIFSVQVGSE
jgi:hypothetical protein